MADGTGKHAQGANHQAGDKQKPYEKPNLTSKYQGRHVAGKDGK